MRCTMDAGRLAHKFHQCINHWLPSLACHGVVHRKICLVWEILSDFGRLPDFNKWAWCVGAVWAVYLPCLAFIMRSVASTNGTTTQLVGRSSPRFPSKLKLHISHLWDDWKVKVTERRTDDTDVQGPRSDQLTCCERKLIELKVVGTTTSGKWQTHFFDCWKIIFHEATSVKSVVSQNRSMRFLVPKSRNAFHPPPKTTVALKLDFQSANNNRSKYSLIWFIFTRVVRKFADQ